MDLPSVSMYTTEALASKIPYNVVKEYHVHVCTKYGIVLFLVSISRYSIPKIWFDAKFVGQTF